MSSITGGFSGGVFLGASLFFPTIADFNGDGLLEPLGFVNTGAGTFASTSYAGINTVLERFPGRIDRDNRVFDIDGDGYLDILWNVYADPADAKSITLIFYGDEAGDFTRHEERPDITGFGETIVVADFNNDGWSDTYLPAYTHVEGTDSGYLLLNENGVLGANVAQDWGVGLSGLSVFYRVEGAQAADFDFDGKIDMFVGSHLFLNQGDHFEAQELDPFVFDEGSNLFDYDNDGDFDLVLRLENRGPELFENVDGTFRSKGCLTGTEVISGFGVNVADFDNNGWQDIVFGGPGCLSVFFNFEGEFTRRYIPVDVTSSTPAMSEDPCCGVCQHNSGVCEALAVADVDGDGRLDIFGRAGGNMYFFSNQLQVGQALSLSVLGANGEQNQHGRSVTLTPRERSELVMARVVDSGSGYLSQGQYDLLIGLPVEGAFDVTVYSAAGPLSFVASAGQDITTFADGRVAIIGSALSDIMGGSSGADILSGGAGDDLLLGTSGDDQLDGGLGVDTIDWTGAAAGVVVDLQDGRVEYLGDVQSSTGIENVRGSAHDDQLTGNAQANLLEGGDGADLLTSVGGGDTLAGGDGDDVYVVRGAAALVIEMEGGGIDRIQTDLQEFALPDHVERLQGLAAGGQVLIGNGLANIISGSAGASIFRGGGGDDVYLVDTDNLVEERADEGMDEVRTALSIYTLTANVERLTGTSASGQTLIGNDLANHLSGGGGADIFVGGRGDDIYDVDAGDLVDEATDEGDDEVRTSLAFYAAPENVERITGTAAVAQHLVGTGIDNVFRGGAAGDLFEGLAGNDVYHVGAGDVVREGADAGNDEVRTALSVYTLPENVEALVGLGASGQKLIGNAGANMIVAGAGADTLLGGDGDDVYVVNSALDMVQEKAGAGHDTVRTTVSYGLFVGTAIERLDASDAAATVAMNLGGNAFSQTITGNAGANLLAGGGGGDVLIGLAGNDTYAIDDARDVIIEVEGEGFDLAATFVSYSLAANSSIEFLYARDVTSTAAISLTGNEFSQSINGNAGANLLSGGGGGDTLTGFGGNDTYAIDDARDIIVEREGEGFDRVATYVSYALQAEASIEHLYVRDITSTAAITLTGNAFSQSIHGNAGSNLLKGGGGADILAGFGGDDEYWVDSADDIVIETAGNGTDTVRASTSYALQAGAAVEHLSAFDPTSTLALNLSGSRFAQTITGNAGANVLAGGGGGDVLIGLEGNDTYAIDDARDIIIEQVHHGFDRVATFVSYTLQAEASIEHLYARDITSTAAITLTGNGFSQSIHGNAGSNLLEGGGGADILAGFGGDDEYWVDSADDIVIETAGNGTDTVRASTSYALQAGAAVETLSAFNPASTLALDLSGSRFAQIITGNAGANVLAGGGGGDILIGLEGNDTYAIDDARDIIVERDGEGFDLVATFVSYALADGVSVELLYARDITSNAALTLTGNRFAQSIHGNAGSNVLAGGGGGDILIGFAGDDTYAIDDARDVVVEDEGQGFDSVATFVSYTLAEGVSVEYLYARDITSDAALTLTGNRFAQSIHGNDGDNILNGGGGQDVLVGFGGRDVFAFSTTPAAGNVVQILDFTVGTDKIGLDRSIFGLPAGATNSAPVRYDPVTGDLLFDAGLAGGPSAQIFAKLAPGLAISESDFLMFG